MKTTKFIRASILLLTALFSLALPATLQAQFTFTTNNGAITITSYTGSSTTVVIPASTNGYPVTGIGNSAFYYFISVGSISIPNSITNIGAQAFAGCIGLTSLVLPGEVNIGDMAFMYCSGLTNINIPNGTKSVGERMFYSCSKLSSVAIGNSVTNIGHEAFRDCTNLTHVTVPDSVASIGIAAFLNCISLTNIVIPVGVTTISNYTFGSCASLTGVTIPTNITSIGDQAFYGCSSLTSITIPAAVTNIGAVAFGYCPGMSQITVDPNNPAYSSLAGVLYDKNQTTLVQFPGGKGGIYVMPNSVTNILGGFWPGNLTKVVISTNVTSISAGLFEYCTNLVSVTIPNGITSINTFAFLGCSSLTSLTIPGMVTNIGNQAFSYCPDLTSLYFTGDAPASIGLNPIDSATVYFLPGTIGWDHFAQVTGAKTILWNPRAQTSGNSFGVRTNRFGFNITGSSNLVIIVEACTNLANPAWSVVGTNTLNTIAGTNGVSYFSDSQWTNYLRRFYRIRSP